VRLFFAIALPDDVRTAVASVAQDLQRQLALQAAGRSAVKWVERENLHVTLRFVGEVDDRQAMSLFDAMRGALPVPKYRATLGHAGCFPGGGPPRVVWVGVGEGTEQTRRVFDAIDARLAPLGFVKEPRPYTPHLTLGRVRENDRAGGRMLRGALEAVPADLGTIEVRVTTLFRSHLSSKGPRYEVVVETPLS
jgi:2'-5' RNA ligase